MVLLFLLRNVLKLQRKHLRYATNPFELPEENFRGVCRLSREMVLNLGNEISPHIQNNIPAIAILTHHKILTTLHFLFQGSYQRSLGQDFSVSMAQHTLSKCQDSPLKILAINARFPGSVRKAAIWFTSKVKMHMEHIFINGDNGSLLIGGFRLSTTTVALVLGGNLTN